MELSLEKALNEIISSPNTIGCLFANKQGLCLGTKGNISPNSAGMASAISEQASKLEPNLNPPIITLESSNKICLISKNSNITGVIFKETSQAQR